MVAELQTVSREACTAMIEHAYAMRYATDIYEKMFGELPEA